MSARLPVYIAVAAALMLGSVAGSMALVPKTHLADIKPKFEIASVFPRNFGDWREVPDVQQVLPDPTVEAVLKATYSQTMARAYISKDGKVVLLSVAYGSDQNSEATAAHRPEFCYTGQGFSIKDAGIRDMTLEPTHHLARRMLIGKRENYVEQISYWVTLDETTALPGLRRKLAQLNYGLRGQIADGMLVRLSTPQVSPEESIQIHERFLRDLHQHFPREFRSRVFGA